MDGNDLVLAGLLALPKRVEKLERAIMEQRCLLTLLLSRSGLDADGVDRAFRLAEEACNEILQERSAQIIEEWKTTPEGRESIRRSERAFQERLQELWREECIEDGRISPRSPHESEK